MEEKKQPENTNKTNDAKKMKRTFSGIVVSTKMDKTAVVEVKRVKMHPKYKKRYFITRKFKVHDEKNLAKMGETVEFIECRPISKDKKWRLIYKQEVKK
ncbi:30S ribosomal protein S17 [Patescibacteria group bacterium]|nr:30S ribosomal protein S17 [Patescibacteria group bacterium]